MPWTFISKHWLNWVIWFVSLVKTRYSLTAIDLSLFHLGIEEFLVQILCFCNVVSFPKYILGFDLKSAHLSNHSHLIRQQHVYILDFSELKAKEFTFKISRLYLFFIRDYSLFFKTGNTLKIDRLNASSDEVFFTCLICNKGYNYGISLFEDFRETV